MFESITSKVKSICNKSEGIATFHSTMKYGDTIVYRISFYGERKPREYVVGKRGENTYYIEGGALEYKYNLSVLYDRITEGVASYQVIA